MKRAAVFTAAAWGAAAAGLPLLAAAAPGVDAFTSTPLPDGGARWSLSLEMLAVMTGLTLLPAALLGMTAFTRIVVVLALLRQALGTGQTPSNQILLGLAVLLTGFVMQPVLREINTAAIAPYTRGEVDLPEAARRGAVPLRGFMGMHTRASDLALFERLAAPPALADAADPATGELSGDGFGEAGMDDGFVPVAARAPVAPALPAAGAPASGDDAASPEGVAPGSAAQDVPLTTLAAAFLTSELKTAFQIGFLLFLPFLVIDLVVASVLMSMGMVMLSPMLISLPFKLMLFVLVDGWALVVGSLAASFGPVGG